MATILRAVSVGALFALTTCGPNGYAIVLHFPDAASLQLAVSTDVFALDSCATIPSPGATPPSARLETTIRGSTGSMALGDIAPGPVALYARARATNCNVVFAGCAQFTVNAGGSGPLDVFLSPVSATGDACENATVCSDGECIAATDAGDAADSP